MGIERIDRNDGIERPPPRMDRGRQMSPVQRQERERFDRRQPDPEFRRDRRDDGNPVEWRPKDRPQQGECFFSSFFPFPNRSNIYIEIIGFGYFQKQNAFVITKMNVNQTEMDDSVVVKVVLVDQKSNVNEVFRPEQI